MPLDPRHKRGNTMAASGAPPPAVNQWPNAPGHRRVRATWRRSRVIGRVKDRQIPALVVRFRCGPTLRLATARFRWLSIFTAAAGLM